MALLQRWEQENYETSVKNESTQQYEEMVNDVRDMLWPYRDKIQDVGNIYTYVPFAKSISARDTELHCDIRYSDGQLSMMFKNTYMGLRDQMFEVHVSKKLFGLHTESSFDDVTYLNGGKWDITQAHDYRCWASECEALKNSDGKIAVFDSYDAAANVLNIMVPGKHIKPTYVELVPKPLTVRTCKSMTEIADSITQDLETSQDFEKGLDYLNDLTMEM